MSDVRPQAATSGDGEPLPDALEYDITVDYKVKQGPPFLRDLWFRARGAFVSFNDGGSSNQVRIIVNYPLTIL